MYLVAQCCKRRRPHRCAILPEYHISPSYITYQTFHFRAAVLVFFQSFMFKLSPVFHRRSYHATEFLQTCWMTSEQQKQNPDLVYLRNVLVLFVLVLCCSDGRSYYIINLQWTLLISIRHTLRFYVTTIIPRLKHFLVCCSN